MNVHRAIAALPFALLLSVGVEPSAASPHGRINAWTTPHVLTISDAGDPNTLNPHLGQSAPVANLSEMTMAWLIRWDKHNEPYPELATEVPTQANGGVSKDGLTITYRLRKGGRWSDGAPFTARDVVFSTAVVNNAANNEAARFDQIARVDEPDKYTVVYHLKRPYATAIEAFFSSCCANPSILPEHLLAKYPNINERWDRSKQIVLVANPLYWRGRPKLAKIVYKIVPDRDRLLAALATHQVDMWYQFGGAYLTRIQALQSYAIARHPSYAYNHIDFNLTHAALADRAVRTALRFALDRHAIVATLGHGVGVVQDSATPVTAPYHAGMGTTPYEPAKANALLDRAGWIRGGDGIRAKNGVKLDLAVAVGTGQPDTDKELAFVQSGWKRIGVALHVEHYPPALMFAPAKAGGIVYGGSWDIVVFAWAADPLGDYSGNYGCDAFPPDEDLFAYNKDLKNYDPNTITPFDNMMNVDIY
jgi:peptide/nickel transport system substrate-binding protein